MSAPLDGIKVVEITSIYSGPLAGVLLAELGADVIKVESQGKPDLVRNARTGPHGVSPVFYALNRGKRFVSLDASTPAGKELLFDLVANSDVFLHNIRPGKPEALGLDYQELAKVNPGLIYVAISGLGHDGPDSAQPVYDYVIQARTGIVDYQRDARTGKASLVSQVIVDKTTSQACVQAVLASLYVRERTGRGQRVDVPMIGVGLHFEWPDAMAPAFSEINPPIPADQLPVHLTMMPAAGLIVVVTGDGCEVACSPQLPPWDGFCIALDRPEWIVDERFSDAIVRALNLPEFLSEVAAQAATFTRDDLVARFKENGVACAPVQRRADVHHDEQIVHLGLISEQDAEHLGRVRQPHPMWHFADTPAAITTSMGRTGEHTTEVLLGRGYTAQKISALIESGVLAQAE